MEYILIHKPVGALPPEAMKFTLDMAKKLGANPLAMVPGAKLESSYYAIGAQAVYCIWDTPNMEALAPLLRNMSIGGWNTDVIPVEKAEVAIPKIEKAMQDLQAQMMGK
jgi:hypothetical protein